MVDLKNLCRDKTNRTTAYAAAVAVVFYLIDQLTKECIVRNVPYHSVQIVIPEFFNITHITNPGAAWGMLAGKGWLLLLISIAALAGIIFFLKKLSENYPERIYGLLLIASGIVGNCTDRIFRGEVVDFLQFHVGRFYWPSFNVADSCITCGVAIFVISTVVRPEKKSSEPAQKPAQPAS